MPVSRKRKIFQSNAPSKKLKETPFTQKDESGKEESTGPGSALKKCVIAVHGQLLKNRPNIPKLVRENGGKYSINVNSKTTHLITTEDECQISHSKVREAQTYKVKIVSEEWLEDCIKEDAKVDEKKYELTVTGVVTKPSRKRGAKKTALTSSNVFAPEEEEEETFELNEEEEAQFQQERMALQLDMLEQHRQKIVRLIDNQSTADVAIIPKEERPVYAHKFILKTNSTFQNYLQQAEQGPKGHATIRLPNISRDLLLLILQAIYTGKADPNPSQIIPLLEICEQFDLFDFRDWLESSLSTIENVCVILEEARQVGKTEDFKKYLRYLEHNADKVTQTESFRSLSPETLAIILDSNSLNISEMELFERLLEWADSRLDRSIQDEELVAKHRASLLNPLFDKIRFPLIEGQELFEIEKLNIVPVSILMEAYRLIARGATEEDSPKCMPRSGGASAKFIKGQWMSLLRKWIAEDAKGKKIGKILFDSKKDQLTNSEFHSKCDRKGATLVVCKATNGYVFGGYANAEWDGAGNYKQDQSAFIFSLSDGKGRKPMKLKQHGRSGFTYGIYCNSAYGPTWGGGHDLYINLDSPTSSYSNLGHSYDIPSGYSQGSNSSGTFLVGSYSGWTVSDMIVFSVK